MGQNSSTASHFLSTLICDHPSNKYLPRGVIRNCRRKVSSSLSSEENVLSEYDLSASSVENIENENIENEDKVNHSLFAKSLRFCRAGFAPTGAALAHS